MRSLRTVTNSFSSRETSITGAVRNVAVRAAPSMFMRFSPFLTCRCRTGRGRVGASKAVRRRAFNRSRDRILVFAACRDAAFRSPENLAGIHDAGGGERLLDRSRSVAPRAELALQELDLAGADAVLARRGAVEVERAQHHAVVQRLGARSRRANPG